MKIQAVGFDVVQLQSTVGATEDLAQGPNGSNMAVVGFKAQTFWFLVQFPNR